MKQTAYSKAVKINEEEDLLSFLEWSHISMKYYKDKGLVITFPDNVENYSYFAVGSHLLYIIAKIGNETRRYGSLK